MAQERIKVRYTGTELGGNAAPWYHKYIHYTDRDGNQYYARGGPNANLQLGTEYGAYLPGTRDFDADGKPDLREEIMTGDDLSGDWQKNG